MKRYKIKVSYDGSDYAGWQVQPNGVTIQEKIEEALKKLTGERIKIHGSGRTDQGVHARMQVAHFDMESSFKVFSLQKALNAILPADIRINKVETAADSFHARRSAVSKEYRYFIWNAEIMPPFLRRYRAHVWGKLDVEAMKKAAAYLIGRHDFTSFTVAQSIKITDSIRNLAGLKVSKYGHEIEIIAEGEGFLYKMVRSLAGFLIRVGQGAVLPGEARAILHAKNRTAKVPTAPPQGLFLWRVDY